MIDALVAVGYDEVEAWHFTPRKGWALLFAAGKRLSREDRKMLALFRMAMHGDQKDLRKVLKDPDA